MSSSTTTTQQQDRNNTVIAFALVLGAGASTAIGAAVVFFPFLVKLANRRTLAAALGLSAGVMTYVSFVEIFNKSVASFVNGGRAENIAYSYATVCFFAGVVLMVVSGGQHSFMCLSLCSYSHPISFYACVGSKLLCDFVIGWSPPPPPSSS